MRIRYLEIVTTDVDAVCATYDRAFVARASPEHPSGSSE